MYISTDDSDWPVVIVTSGSCPNIIGLINFPRLCIAFSFASCAVSIVRPEGSSRDDRCKEKKKIVDVLIDDRLLLFEQLIMS